MSALPWCTSRGKRRWTTGGCRREASCWPSGGQRPWRAPGPGAVRDFVAVGDVEIKVIGAECAIPDCQAPVRMILEQLIAQTGIPPFLLGLNWSSTERMSSQQADIMTSELAALRRTLTPVVEKICTLWLRMHGKDCAFQVEWEEIDLQDQVEEARAALYRQQAEQMARGEQRSGKTTGEGGSLCRQ